MMRSGWSDRRALHRRRSGVDRRSFVAVEIQNPGQSVCDDLLVVDNQNSRFLDRVHSVTPCKVAKPDTDYSGAAGHQRPPIGCKNYPLRLAAESNFCDLACFAKAMQDDGEIKRRAIRFGRGVR